MTDNEIKKALEEKIKFNTEFYESEEAIVKVNVLKTSLDLINRQQAEIERLQNTLDDVLDREPLLVERSEKYAKAEAYKEFVEKWHKALQEVREKILIEPKLVRLAFEATILMTDELLEEMINKQREEGGKNV